MNWNDLTAVFGGSFDPPHLGHREAIAGLFKVPGIREVVVVPAGRPALKNVATSAEERLYLCKLNLSPDRNLLPLPKEVRIDPLEIEQSLHHSSTTPIYSYDTILKLRRDLPKMAFVIGLDQWENLLNWHRFPEVLGLCHWIVLLRKESPKNLHPHRRVQQMISRWESLGLLNPSSRNEFPLLDGKTFLGVFETPAREVSSTQIREAFQKGQIKNSDESHAIKRDLHPLVWEYLIKEGTYGTPSSIPYGKSTNRP